MTPVEQAAAIYERESCARTFREDLELHLLNGFVISGPDFFMMGRPVCKYWGDQFTIDPTFNPTNDKRDCWHCYLMAGNMLKAFQFVPYPLPFISFERKNKLRFYRLDELKKRLLSKN